MKQNGFFQWLSVSLFLILLAACAPAAATPEVIKPSDGGSTNATATVVKPKAARRSTQAPRVTTSKDSEPPPVGILFNAKQETVSASSINRVPPEDVLPEISFPGGGGGPSCMKTQYTQPEYEPMALPQDVTLMEAPLLLSCGWAENEQVRLTVHYPDGRAFSHDYTAEGGLGIYYVYATYQIGIDDPTGIYTFVEEGSSGKIETQVNVNQTSGPILFPIYKDPFNFVDFAFQVGHPRMLLYGFAPNETVQLVMYQGDTDLNRQILGTQQVVTGPDGNLVILNEQPDASFWVAVGQQTGIVSQAFYNIYGEVLGSYPMMVQCDTVKPTRVSSLKQIRVAYTDGKNLRMRKEAGFNQEVFTSIPEGTTLEIMDMPECADQTWWWYVRTGDTMGWVAEADPEVYLIEPLP